MTLGELYGSTKKETHNYSLPSRHIFSLFAFSRFQVCNLLYILFHALVDTQLSKGTSDLKQKCTQLATPFGGTVFHALSQGVSHFVRSVRSRNHFLFA